MLWLFKVIFLLGGIFILVMVVLLGLVFFWGFVFRESLRCMFYVCRVMGRFRVFGVIGKKGV